MPGRGAGQLAKVLSSETRGGRVLVDVQASNGDVRSRVPLYVGFVTWRPAAGADVLLLEVNGARSQLIAIPDEPSLRLEGLAENEVGLPGPGGQSIVMRADGSLVVTLNASPVTITGASDCTLAGDGTATLDFPAIKLGAAATVPVMLADNTASTIVRAE